MCDTGPCSAVWVGRLRGASGLREAGIGTGCLVGCRAAVGRGPGGVGGRGCHRGRGQVGGASVDGASVDGPVSGRAGRRAGGSVASAGVVSASGAGARWRWRWRRCGGSIRGGVSRRIRLELLRRPLPWQPSRLVVVPSERDDRPDPDPAGAGAAAAARSGRGSRIMRFERPGPMQLWGIDIVGGIRLVDPVDRVSCGRPRSSPGSMTTPGSA